MRRGNLFWGVVLIILGGLFLLEANGLINDVLGWFWPILLILLGVWVLAGRYLPRSIGEGETFSVDLQGAVKLNVEIDQGAGSLSIEAGTPPGVALTGSQGTAMDVKSNLSGDSLDIKMSAGPSFLPFLGPEGGEWRINLAKDMPVALKVDAGASNLNFDMTDVKLSFLGVDTGASSLKVKLPAQAGRTVVDIESGAASIDLQVPAGVGGRIRIEQGASAVNIDTNRFPQVASEFNLYQSIDFDSSANKVEINLEGGANSVRVS